MSAAPRPYSQSPSRVARNGAVRQRWGCSAGTTSTWPLRMSERPTASAPGGGPHVATTSRLPSTSQEKGECAGWARSAAPSSGTSIGSSPAAAYASAITACPGSSWPSTVGCSTSRTSRSSMAPASARTAAAIAASSTWSGVPAAMAAHDTRAESRRARPR